MNKQNNSRYSRAMLSTFPISFCSSVFLPIRQQRTITLRGPAVLISRSSPEAPELAYKLIVLSQNTRPFSIGKHYANLSGLKISFPDSQTRDSFLAAAHASIRHTSVGIDRYTAYHELGRGAAGIVFLVKRRSDGKRFAMKTIAKTDAYISDSRLANLISERTALAEAAQRRSPFIIKLVDAIETDQQLCFVTELAEYGDLRGVLERVEKRHLSEGASRILFAEALMGLEESHRMGFLFRDMKLGNLLLNKNGHLKMADFGLAKRMQVEYEGTSVSSVSSNDGSEEEEPFRLVGRTTSFVGTRRYMSPEHLSGSWKRKRGYGAPADVWALGVALYVMLTGEYPFGRGLSSRDTASMFYSISNEELRFPKWVGKEVRLLLEGMLDRDASERLELGAIKEHAWMNGIDWDALRCKAKEDAVQEKVLEELREEGILIESKQESSGSSDERCRLGSSISSGYSSTAVTGLDRMELVGFGYTDWV